MLASIKKFYTVAMKHEIVFCHWKSNATLDLAVNGKTDLDLLFYEKDRAALEAVFKEIGAVKFNAVKEKRYPKIDDFLLVDSEEGRLIHFHVHYQLDVGEKMVKSYRLPWVEDILTSRVKHPDIDFWIVKPEIELMLLLVRQALRIPPFTFYIRKLPSIGKGTQHEFAWLKKRCDLNYLEEVCNKWFTPKIAVLVLGIIKSGITIESILQLRKLLRRYYSRYREQSHLAVFISLFAKKIRLKLKRNFNRFGFQIPLKRVFQDVGIIIAFAGVDGSGKSTFVERSIDFFTQKIDVAFIYFGHGKSHKSIVISVFRLASKVLGRINRSLSQFIFNIGIAIDKYIKFRKARRAKAKGMVVICDRYPQTNVHGWCDGLRLHDYESSRNPLLRAIARWEKRIYLINEIIAPDIIFRIIVDTEKAFERKKAKSYEYLDRKNTAMNQVVFPRKSRTVDLDNNNSELDQLMKRIAVEVWSTVNNKPV